MAEPGITQTEVLKLNKPEKGYFDWDVPLNENWDKLDVLGAGQLPLLTPLEVTYKLEGAAALGWALQGSVLDGNMYTSLWDLLWAARQRAGTPNQSVTLYGKTYYISRDSVTGMYFTTEDSFNRGWSEIGSSLGHVCEYDETAGTKKIILWAYDWIHKDIVDYSKTDGTALPGWSVGESLPNIKGTAYNILMSYQYTPSGNGPFNVYRTGNEGVSGSEYTRRGNIGFNAQASNDVYQDGARVQPRAHAAYRYYKVGNTVANSGTIDMGNVLDNLAELETEVSRITDVMNTMQSQKDSIVGFINPNVASIGLANGTQWRATYNAWVYFVINTPYNGFSTGFQINGVNVQPQVGTSHTNGHMWYQPVPLKKGQVITWTGGTGGTMCISPMMTF